MPRIASLLPSLTEIACALGQRPNLVGRSHECDYPAEVRSLPVLTEPKFEPEGSSREIDDRVKAIVRDGLSVYRVDAEKLRELAPDVILTQDHCEVCAVSLPDVEAAVADWTGHETRVVSVSPDTLGDVWRSITTIADAVGAGEAGAELVARLTDRVSEIGERTGGLTPRPRVTCVEWIDPLMAAGNWIPEVVALAGGEVVFGEAGAHSPWVEWKDVQAADPDVVVVMPCGFGIPRTRKEIPLLEALPGWGELRAVREGHAFVVDGNQYFNRPGPRLVESVEILAEILHPDRLDFGHAGRGYERV